MKKYFFSALCCYFLSSIPLWSSSLEDTKLIIENIEKEDPVSDINQQDKTESSYSREELANLVYKDIKDKVISALPHIYGYMQAGYAYSDKNAGNSSSFQMKRMRILFDKKLSNYFDVNAQFEVFSGSTDAQYKKKVMAVVNAYIDGHVNKMINFRLGQFHIPFGYETYDISGATSETIDFSGISNWIESRNPVSYPDFVDFGTDIGVMMYGSLFENKDQNFSYLNYNLAVTNGNLATQNDNNKSKDIIGRIDIRPIKKLRVTASYNWGEYKQYGLTPEETRSYVPMGRVIAGAWYYDPNGLDVRSEYAYVQSNEANVKEDGLYVLAAYTLGKFQPVVRWDMYRDRKDKFTDKNRDAYLLGCNYNITKSIRLQANYTYFAYTKDAKKSSLGSKSNNGNLFQLMCLARF